jgi:hypothetical protein
MRIQLVFVASLLACVSTAHAFQVTEDASAPKHARPLSVTADVKTPAPPVAGATGTLITPVAHVSSAPARTAKPAVPGIVTPRLFDRVYVDQPQDGVVWARGRAYKARFGALGVTYVPFFGSAAPQNYPTRFTLRDVRVGDAALAFDAEAVPVLDSDSVRYERGSLIEHWDLHVESVEQRFEFEALPAGGDLVLAIALESELAAAESHGGISFTNDLGRVDYSAAVAIDAGGRRLAMHTHLVDGVLELRLDAAALAGARMPLVIDPVLTTTNITSAGIDDINPDVAYEAASDRYAVVYEELYSATDHDIYLQMRDGSGALTASNWIDITTDFWATPRVASNTLGLNYLCVASVGLASSGLRTIQGRTINPNGVTSAPITIAGLDTYDKFAPDVGGDPASSPPTYFLVVWERTFSTTDHDIHARLVTSAGAPVATAFSIDNSSSTLDTRPAISKSDGHPPFSTQNWTIVWQRYNPSALHEQLYGAQVKWDGSVTHATFPVNVTGDVVRNPRVSSLLDDNGTSRPYMIVCESQSLTFDWEVAGYTFVGTTFQTGTSISDQVDVNSTLDNFVPCVDSDGRHFTVAYSELYNPQTADYDIVVTDMLYADSYAFLCAVEYAASTTFTEDAPSITSTYSGNGARVRYMLAWDKNDYQVGDLQAWIGLWDGCPSGIAEPFCLGDGSHTACPCANTGASGRGCENSSSTGGGYMTWSGQNQVGNDTFVIQANGLPPGSASLYFQGFLAAGGIYGAAFGDGILCITTQIVRLGVKFNPTGSSQFPGVGDPSLSIAGSIPAGGKYVFYQVWYRDAVPFCSSATYNLTSGIRTVWAPY